MTFLSKQSKLEKAISKYEERHKKGLERDRLKRLHDDAWAKVSAFVSVRDKMLCRVCGCKTNRWGVGHPRSYGSAHHIVYRSAGGKDTPDNCVWTCWTCHDMEHRHELSITGTASALTIERL